MFRELFRWMKKSPAFSTYFVRWVNDAGIVTISAYMNMKDAIEGYVHARKQSHCVFAELVEHDNRRIVTSWSNTPRFV